MRRFAVMTTTLAENPEHQQESRAVHLGAYADISKDIALEQLALGQPGGCACCCYDQTVHFAQVCPGMIACTSRCVHIETPAEIVAALKSIKHFQIETRCTPGSASQDEVGTPVCEWP